MMFWWRYEFFTIYRTHIPGSRGGAVHCRTIGELVMNPAAYTRAYANMRVVARGYLDVSSLTHPGGPAARVRQGIFEVFLAICPPALVRKVCLNNCLLGLLRHHQNGDVRCEIIAGIPTKTFAGNAATLGEIA